MGVVDGAPVVFATGNFAFGSDNRRADEALLVRAILRGTVVDRVELHPLAIRNTDRAVRYQPKVLRGRSAADVLERLRTASAPLGADLKCGRTGRCCG